MTVPVVVFFNNKGGVGKTSLVYHLAWMFGELGVRVAAADLDPQANLTVSFVDERRLEELWPDAGPRHTVFGALEPLIEGVGDIGEPHFEIDRDASTSPAPALLPGDLMLSQLEDELGDAWFRALDGNARSFRVVSAFWRLIQRVAARTGAEVCLVDVGPNLGAINRAALIAADHVVVPLAPDLFSLQGLKNLGPTLRSWRAGWQTRLPRKPPGLEVPEGLLQPGGYVVLQHSVRLDRPVRAYEKWISRIPIVYAEAVLDQPVSASSIAEDPNCLGMLKHYRSLVPMAQEAGKPMFFLKPADGAIGSHLDAVHRVYQDFEVLARAIAGRIGLALPAALPGVPE